MTFYLICDRISRACFCDLFNGFYLIPVLNGHIHMWLVLLLCIKAWQYDSIVPNNSLFVCFFCHRTLRNCLSVVGVVLLLWCKYFINSVVAQVADKMLKCLLYLSHDYSDGKILKR